MSRRKQANPAKLGESDAGSAAPMVAAGPGLDADGKDIVAKPDVPEEFPAIDFKQENSDETENDNKEDPSEAGRNGCEGEAKEDNDEEDENDDDDLDDTDDDDDGSLLNGQGSSPLSSSDQASPASSCQSSLSDGADTEEGGYTLGATPTTPYECDVCKRAFARSSQLSKHMQTHTEQLQFSCPYCRRLFKHKRSRDRHTKLHTGDKKYKCLHCESAFARSDHLKIHMKTHDNKKPHQCDLCNRGYNTAAALASHQQHHSKQEARRCESSNSRSSVSGSSPSPVSLHSSLIRCIQCGESFDKADALQSHQQICRRTTGTPGTPPQVNSTMNLPKIACMYCAKDFASMAQMYSHIHAEHRAIYLNNTASHPPPLDLHSPSEANIEDLSPKTRPASTPTYACDRCTMRFDSSPLLQEHVENVHWNYQSTRYKFEYDRQSEPKPTDLSRKRRHDDEWTKSEKRLAPETTTQDGSSPYEANDKPCICSYCYAQMPNFKMFLLHMETHVINSVAPTLPQKSHMCPLCGETAKSALDLGRHIFGHAIANVAAYCCHACKKPFEKADHLRKHLLEAHAQTIFKCTLCNEIFDNDQSLQVHFATKHTAECKHFRCNLCSDQIFHDRLTAELHVNMKHSLTSPHHQSVTTQGTPATTPFLGVGYLPELDHRDRSSPYFQCPFCQKLFKDEYLQYVHILREHNHRLAGNLHESKHSKQIIDNQRFRCAVCQKVFSSDAELTTHKKLHHTKLRTVSLQCAYCNEHCKSRSDLEHHMKTHQGSASGKGKHKCNICDEIFASGTTLAEHKLSHCKIVDGNSCTQCKTLLTDEQCFYNHQLQHGTSSSGGNSTKNMLSLPANCIVCCQTLQTDVEIKLHASFHLRHLRQQTHHQQKEYACAVCNKLVDTSKLHNMQSVFVCIDCATMAPLANGNGNGNKSPAVSPSKSPSKTCSPITRSTETNEKLVFACLKCPRKFSTEDESQSHAKSHLQDETTMSLECHLCRNVLSSTIKLQIHLIEHNFMGIGQYRCYICSSVFTTAAGLRGHIVEHGPDHRPYDCSDCHTKFYFETELENHKFIHLQQSKATYEKYVECSRCGASVPEVTYYSEHMHSCTSASSNGRHTSIVNIKVENNLDYDVRSEIKTEADHECNAPVV